MVLALLSSVHVDIEISHEIIDRIERDAAKTLGIFLVIHMDPVEMKDEYVLKVKSQVIEIMEALDKNVSIHDFRMVDGQKQINLIFSYFLYDASILLSIKVLSQYFFYFSTMLF